MLDVQVIEHMYGTSTDTNLGDTTYSFADKEFFLKTIVDSGGTDTIDGSNQTEEVWINLNGVLLHPLEFGMRMNKKVIGSVWGLQVVL